MARALEVPAALEHAERRGFALVAGCFLTVATAARAVEAPSFELLAPEGCPGPEALKAAIVDLVGQDFDPTGMRLEITRGSLDWRARLSLPEGQRLLEGESCAAVADAAAVVVALSLEGRGETQPAPSSARPDPPPAGTSAAAQPAEAPPPSIVDDSVVLTSPPATSERRLRWMLHLGLMGEVGLLPGPSLGPRLRASFELGSWGIDAGGAVLLARHAELRSGESASIHWFGGQLAACRSVKGPLRACFGGEVGRIVGTGSGVDDPVTASGSWLAVTAEASFRGTVAEPLGWELGVGAASALVRPEFGFDEVGVLHRASSVSGRLFGGVAW